MRSWSGFRVSGDLRVATVARSDAEGLHVGPSLAGLGPSPGPLLSARGVWGALGGPFPPSIHFRGRDAPGPPIFSPGVLPLPLGGETTRDKTDHNHEPKAKELRTVEPDVLTLL